MKTLNGKKRLTILGLRLLTYRKTKPVASEAFSSLQTCFTRDADLKARIGEEENNLASLITEFAEKQKLEADFRRS